MINSEQIEIINKYVPEKYFFKERLIQYLALHDVVGGEVFNHIAKKVFEDAPKGFETVLPPMFLLVDRWGLQKPYEEEEKYSEFVRFEPEDIETFIRRVPFNFYYEEIINTNKNGEEVQRWNSLAIGEVFAYLGSTPWSDYNYHRTNPLTLEDAYQKLEYLFYDRGFTLEEIFGYTDKITKRGWGDGIYGDWFDYIDKCLLLGWDDVMPDEFYYKYNLARELTGEEPIMFYIMEYDPEAWTRDREQVQFYKRNGNKLEFYGKFPCDENGQPVMRWIGIDIKNEESIVLSERDGLESHMVVTLTPKTVIHALIRERDDIGEEIPGIEPKWVQIYAGPQTMTFNYKVLKRRRVELGYTQQEMADAVEANVRTYQKWENGETKPDGYFLLRILNWLDIPNVNDVIIYDE